MEENIKNPIEELKQINRAIKKYEVVLKTSSDSRQKKRVKKELIKLKNYKEKLQHVFSIIEEQEEVIDDDEFKDFPFLSQIIDSLDEKYITDREINFICHILYCFENEFLPLLTERKMKLDFKYSLERDSFYNIYQDLTKRVEDFRDQLEIIEKGKYTEGTLLEIKNRLLKKRRILLIETDRFFRKVKKFSDELLKDIEKNGSECLNKDDSVNFDLIEGKRYLEGYTVTQSLQILNTYAKEVILYLNLPEIIVQEQ
jgi:hypothetical protein